MRTSRLSFTPVITLALAALFVALLSVPASAKDEWIQVRSRNFFLIGNAPEKDIRKVATRLEQFRQTFRSLFTKSNLTSSVATNVIVFKSGSAYKPFKPKRADGKINENVVGYFQHNSDVNYITLSTEGDDREMFSTIFHEYVHFIVETNFGKSEVPPWFNEGLAEYYSTFEIVDDQKVNLGYPPGGRLQSLQSSQLIPLEQLFNIDSYQLHQAGNHGASIFYAESWALVHYLLQNGKTDPLGKFLDALSQGEAPKDAFERVFQTTYRDMETDLTKYIAKGQYRYNIVVFKNKLLFDDSMTAEPMTEAVSQAYLGDLLVHANRPADAEPFLQAALKLDPNSSLANAASGMAMMRQKKFNEARTFFEKAVAGDRANHLALYWYAYLLSREDGSEFGMMRHFDADTTAKMRGALKKAIDINPSFTESYELLAYIDLVNEADLDEAVDLLKKALRYQPGNQRYALRMAEIMARQKKYDEATVIAKKIADTTDDPETRSRAEFLIEQIHRRDEYEADLEEQREHNAATTPQKDSTVPVLRRGKDRDKPLTEEELARRQQNATFYSITQALRKQQAGETRVMGHIEKIDCSKNIITYTVRTPGEPLVLTSKDFQSLSMNTFDSAASGVDVGCGANISALNALVTYTAGTGASRGSRGELVSIEFVPETFAFVDKLDDPVRMEGTADPMQDPAKRPAITEAIRRELKIPAAGQKRQMGFLEKIDCTNKGIFYNFRTGSGPIRLVTVNPQKLQIRLFNRDLGDVEFGCNLKPIDAPAVFLYTDKPDEKTKAAGEVLAIDFVPKFFTLE